MTDRSEITKIDADAKRQLKGFVQRIELLRGDKRSLSDDERAVFAEAKAAGYDAKTLRRVIKLRAQDLAERHNEQAMLDLYLHALDMDPEPPLFAAMGAVGTDPAARGHAVEALMLLVPEGGEILVRGGNGKPLRIWRDADGEAHVEDTIEPPQPRRRGGLRVVVTDGDDQPGEGPNND